MNKIRKLYFFDKKKIQEMIPFLNSGLNDNYISNIMFNPFSPLHHLLPLKFKFLPESFVLKDEKNIKGLITVAPTKSRFKKMEIQKLLFEENSLFDAAELVQYVVARYKAMGAFSILVKVDDYLPELLTMFVSKCGFSQISYEKLWRVDKFPSESFNKENFRNFLYSDAKVLANLFNDALLPHFRPLLNAEAKDFKENLFKGLSYYSEYKYVIEDRKTKNILGCLIIQTSDNENFILDLVQNNWTELDIDSIISFAVYQIKKRKKRFGLFIKTKRYTTLGEKFENILNNKKYECVQNQIVLTNSSAKVLYEKSKSGKYTLLSDFFPAKSLIAQCKEL